MDTDLPRRGASTAGELGFGNTGDCASRLYPCLSVFIRDQKRCCFGGVGFFVPFRNCGAGACPASL
jgi:hypothetical protein